jgi:hypothetical protein
LKAVGDWISGATKVANGSHQKRTDVLSFEMGLLSLWASGPASQGSYARYAYGRYELTETTWSYGYLYDTHEVGG